MAGGFLKQETPVPVFDVIGPALLAAKKLKGKIGVIGTRATIVSGAYKVDYSVSCPLLVPFIEEGELTGAALNILVKKYLTNFKRGNVDTLILGCTHYPLIVNLIQKVIGKNVQLINPGVTVAQSLFSFLKDNTMLNSQKRVGEINIFVTDLTDRFIKVARMFLGEGRINKITRVDV